MQTPDRYAKNFPEPFGSDFVWTNLTPSPDRRPRKGVDDWGCEWDNIGEMQLGEVKDSPLKDWDDFGKLPIPDISAPEKWANVNDARAGAGDKYIHGGLISMYERVHFVRGLENVWCDIRECPDNLRMFVGLIADLNVAIIGEYAKHDIDSVFFCDDWGLQDRLMINPVDWRAIWKPFYKKVFDAAHAASLDVWMHSCGYITDILGDLIEIGLDAVHMDQQENMGLENLGRLFKGKITFHAPVDIQQTMVRGAPDEIRAYCRRMAEAFGTNEGGFIPCCYSDPVGAGHTRENIEIMCGEFLRISDEIYGAKI